MSFFRRVRSIFTPSAWDILAWIKTVPAAAAFVTAVSGYLQSLQWMYILVGASLVFMSVGLGLVGYRLFVQLMDPEHKLKFCRPKVSRGEDAVVVAAELRNDATFPIDVRIEELRTTVAGRTTRANRTMTNREFTLSPGDMTDYSDAVIDIGGITSDILESTFEISITYGRQNGRKYKIIKNLSLTIPLDRAGNISWSNRVDPNNNNTSVGAA